MYKKIKTAVFPVGGLGTRFLPATKSMPKEMLTVVDKPIIQYAFEEARDAGIEQFIFITGRNKNIISNHFDHAYELQKVLDADEKDHLLELTKDWLPEAGNIAFIRQQEPLGLGHSIYCARNFIGDEPFIVLLADEMLLSQGRSLLSQMIDLHSEKGGNVIGVADVDISESVNYGMVKAEEDNGTIIKISDMIEKPLPENSPSNISMVGRYILQPEIFSYLENTRGGKDNEIQLTDSMKAMIEKTPTNGIRFSGSRYDCGSKIGFLEANIAFALNRDDLGKKMQKIVNKYCL